MEVRTFSTRRPASIQTQRGNTFESLTSPQPVRAPGRAAPGCLVHYVRCWGGLHALLHCVPGRLHRGVRLEPWRELNRLLGVAADQRRDLAVGWRPGGSAGTTPACADRGFPPGGRTARQLLRKHAVASDPALRRGDDTGCELPRAGGFR